MNKKIYYIAHCRFPSERAHAIQVAKMIEAMSLNGFEVELIVPDRENAISQSPKNFYGLQTDILVKYLKICDLYRFGKLGYRLSGLSFILAYRRFIKERQKAGEKFLLYTIDMDQFSLIGVSFLHTPFVVEVHDAKKYSWIFNRMFKRATAILTINNLIKNEIVKTFSLSSEKVLVQPNGIDLQMFSKPADKAAWRGKWSILLNRPFVLYVGKCYDWKGLEIFDQALKALPEINFGFVGCSKGEVEKMTGQKYDLPNVLFFSQRPYTEMVDWMRSADILLVIGTKKNEYSYYHTSPMKLFEYLATGVPILVADTPAIKDMVSEKEVFFYQADNSESFVSSIRKIISDQKTAGLRSAEALNLAGKLSWSSRVLLVLNFVKNKL
ncbi:MAG: glycosyltransferase [Candidatus Paceibacterota bacterium]|jgi:glycosyltransferase involved in cell wall biosynthesis